MNISPILFFNFSLHNIYYRKLWILDIGDPILHYLNIFAML